MAWSTKMLVLAWRITLTPGMRFMAVYFASDNTADGSRSGLIDHPFLDPE